MPNIPDKIIFFDGYCGLCDGFVHWLTKRDQTGQFAVTPLQGETAKLLLPPGYAKDLSTVVYREGETLYTHSDAVLRAISHLPHWSWVHHLLWVPRFLRNGVYRGVAAIRYPVFGKKSTCGITRPENINMLP